MNHVKNRGFTLIEVMVALVVMALLSGTAYKGVAVMIDARERIEESVKKTNELQTALSQWSNDWEAASSLRMHSGVRYDGSSVTMVRYVPGGLGQVVAWRQTPEGFERVLFARISLQEDIYRQWSEDSKQWIAHGTVPKGATATKWPQLTNFQMYYFVGSSWTNPYSTFSDGEGWPSAVRLELKTPRGFISSDWLDLNAAGAG